MSVNIQTSSGLVKIAGTPTIDTDLSNVSKNPVQNKVVTEKFDEINSNLDTLEYGDTHGGYNIFKDTTWVVGRHMAENGINDYPETGSAYSDYISIFEPNTYYISSFTHPKSTVFEYDANKSFIKYNGWKKDNNTPCVLSGNCAYIRISFNGASSNIQPSNVMLAKTPNLPYEPYIPSVKMLASENEQQNTEAMDLKMLGWTVPKECPIQNYTDSDGVFHQKVGRVDLGSLEWTYDTLWKATSGVSTIKNLTVNMYHSVYVPTIANVSDIPTNSVKKADSGTLWINNGSSTEKPSGYLYFELAEEKTIKVDGNEAVTKVNESLSVIGKCKNLLNPILQTTTVNGITCTNNGDGTYTLNGTASESFAQFTIGKITLPKGTYKIIGNPKITSCELYISGINYQDIGNGVIIEIKENIESQDVYFYIPKDTTLSNAVLKPIITTNINATYDDFVPYTGDGETLTHDVAEIKNDLSNLMKVETVAYSGTIDLGLYELAYDLPTIQGYTPIGVVGHAVNRNDGLYVHSSYLKDGKVYIDGYSNKNQGIVYATAFVLYAIN